MEWIAATREVGGCCQAKDKENMEGIMGGINTKFKYKFDLLMGNLKLKAKMAMIWFRIKERKMKQEDLAKQEEEEKQKLESERKEKEKMEEERRIAKIEEVYRSNKPKCPEAYKDYFDEILKSHIQYGSNTWKIRTRIK